MSIDIDPSLRGLYPSVVHISSPLSRRENTTALQAIHMARHTGILLDPSEVHKYTELRELSDNKSTSDQLVLAQILSGDKLERFRRTYHPNIFPFIQ